MSRAARAASAMTPPSSPTDTGPEDIANDVGAEPAEKNEISHRGRAARLLAGHLGLARDRPGAAMIRTKSGAAALSIASNALLIAIKLAAGAITGSIAIITEAVHSLIDLVASVVAFVSVRKADEPADAEHPYGHEKVESLAATIEGMLILVGAGIIVYEATHRLVVGARSRRSGRHGGDGSLDGRQPGRLDRALPPGAGLTNRRPWRATPPTCAPTR